MEKAVDILILGADGQQGVIASRLLLRRGYKIACADIYLDAIRRETNGHKIEHVFCDHRHPKQLYQTIGRFRPRAVLNCADDFYNDNVLDACLRHRVHCIDLGSDIKGTRRRIARHRDLQKAGIVYITGCGSVPGVGSVMLRYIADQFESMSSAEAGFAWNSNTSDFVPPFFLFVVVLELSNDAEIMVNGKIKHVSPLSVYETRRFPLVGKQVVYVVPHSEVWSYHHYFKHKGLKNVKFYAGFPEHSKVVIDSLIKAGLGYNRSVRVIADEGEAHVHPCDFLTVMSKRIPTPKGYKECENIWVQVDGKSVHGRRIQSKMQCIVPPLKGWERYGCNVDTAFPACIVTEMVLNSVIPDRGAFCPEGVVPPKPFIKQMESLGFSFRNVITHL